MSLAPVGLPCRTEDSSTRQPQPCHRVLPRSLTGPARNTWLWIFQYQDQNKAHGCGPFKYRKTDDGVIDTVNDFVEESPPMNDESPEQSEEEDLLLRC